VTASRFDAADVARYYERHTPAFVRLGHGRGAIRRAVWGPGVTSRAQAFHDVDERIAALVRQMPTTATPAHVVDLGCGVGASLCYLAERLPMRGTGITISPAQVALASRRIAAAGLSSHVRCVHGDYNQLPGDVGQADLAFAIESFVHGGTPARFFDECARLVKPGGLLVICDDVRRVSSESEADGAIGTFMRGWHLNTLLAQTALRDMARAAGFDHESTIDLTPYLEIARRRDRAIAVLLAALKRLPLQTTRFDPLIGGHALQTCLARGWVGYEFTVFRRRERSR